jgi:ADP-ribose pyrophosphatase
MSNPLDLTETCLSSTPIFEGRVLRFKRDEVRLPNGHTGIREIAMHPGGVVVLPILDDGRLILVAQYRYALGRVSLELPAGKLDGGEEPFAAIQRELREETGYVASQWDHLGCIHTAPGFCDEKLWLYRASGLTPQALTPEEKAASDTHDEFLERVVLTPAEVLEKIRTHEITDAKTICLMSWHLLPGLANHTGG